jgi:energy-coupling factor transport system ATP-binding protein
VETLEELKVENLRLKYPKTDQLLIRDLSITITKGEKVLLLGPSGCGKSTLLQVLSGLIPNTYQIPMKAEYIKRAESFGYVFQDSDTQFCMPSVDEELAFALENLNVPREDMDQKIDHLLESVGIPLTYKYESIHSLSGGMKQRLAIAGAIASDPEVLFLDEPTAMIDSIGTKELWKTLKELSVGKTVVIVEHKVDEVIDYVDTIYLFGYGGNILAKGTKEEMLSVYRPLLKEYGIWYPGVWGDFSRMIQNENVSSYKKDTSVIRLENFRGYRKRKEIISISSLSVNEGEWIVITGPNGVGKSTFLHSLVNLVPTTGTYEFNNKPFQRKLFPLNNIGYVFQNPEHQFIENSVYEEIAFSCKKLSMDVEQEKRMVDSLLQTFHLHHVRQHHPYQLSQGQKRRLSVAVAIVSEPPLLLLDEPTFGQDAKNTFELLLHLKRLKRQGTAIVMVTHDERIVETFANKRWNIENGLLTEDVVRREKTVVSGDYVGS